MTSSAQEEQGIHFHGYTDNFVIPSIDDTFDTVTIDGVPIDEVQLRVLMAQQHLSHLAGRVVSLSCPHCGAPHFDHGALAYTPHSAHRCGCGATFSAKGRMKLVVSNPMIATLAALEKHASLKRRYFR